MEVLIAESKSALQKVETLVTVLLASKKHEVLYTRRILDSLAINLIQSGIVSVYTTLLSTPSSLNSQEEEMIRGNLFFENRLHDQNTNRVFLTWR